MHHLFSVIFSRWPTMPPCILALEAGSWLPRLVVVYLFINLFIYYYSTEGPKATYTVGKSTRSEKHMQHAINKTQGNRKKEL